MEREALAALEKRVEALRLLAAETAVFARSVRAEPPRHHAEISTALLALVVFVAFLAGREIGSITSHGSCAAIPSGQFASVTVATDTWSVTLDTNGTMQRTGSLELHHPETVKRSVSPEIVRALANRLARGCFFDHQPAKTGIADGVPLIVTLRSGDRMGTYDDKWPSSGPLRLCNGDDSLGDIADAVMNLARVREELFTP